MSIPSTDYQAVADILYRLRTDHTTKLRFGANKRSELKSELDTGVTPDHYRIRWLYSMRDELAKWLGAQAKAFNLAHPHDACSVNDLIDVTMSTLLLLQKVQKAKD